MRSSKSRQRSKQNRPRTLGNIVNRVFDSSGPEGKVRGTPQQIIEKYLILARDAQLSNDRVAAENFQQHAEHYTRMLGEAQREMQAEQEARQQQGGFRREDRDDWQGGNGDRREGQPWRDGERRDGNQGGGQGGNQGGERQPWRDGNQGGDRRDGGQGGERRDGNQGGDRRDGQSWRDGNQGGDRRDQQPRRDNRSDQRPPAPVDVIDLADDPRDSGLVETPEAAAAVPETAPEPVASEPRARRARGPRKPRDEAAADDAPAGDAAAAAE
jgi:hypothetical protein